jgi:hypothetical protein
MLLIYEYFATSSDETAQDVGGSVHAQAAAPRRPPDLAVLPGLARSLRDR